MQNLMSSKLCSYCGRLAGLTTLALASILISACDTEGGFDLQGSAEESSASCSNRKSKMDALLRGKVLAPTSGKESFPISEAFHEDAQWTGRFNMYRQVAAKGVWELNCSGDTKISLCILVDRQAPIDRIKGKKICRPINVDYTDGAVIMNDILGEKNNVRFNIIAPI